MQRFAWLVPSALAALIAVGAATAIGRGSGTEEVSATFEARAVGDPHIKDCRDLGEGSYLKFEGQYAGVLRTGGARLSTSRCGGSRFSSTARRVLARRRAPGSSRSRLSLTLSGAAS